MRLAQNNDIGFRYHGSRLFQHIWLSEHEKRPLTRDEKDSLHYLQQQGYLRMQHAVGAFGRGYYEIASRSGYVFTTDEDGNYLK